jgi:glutamate--cysteine ligase
MSRPPESQGEPITDKRQLVEYLAQGSKPKSDWRIGTEHEKFAYDLKTLHPLPYESGAGIKAILEGMLRFGWEPIREGDKIIALAMDKCAITLEPGGQFELSGAPLETLHQTCSEVHQHLAQVKEVCGEIGAGMMGLGFNPKWRREDIPWMPKGRYKIMRDYMPKKGSLGLDMMLRTCTIQTNLDFQDEADMVKKFRVSLALQPIATALFASSPFTEGKPNGFQSFRSHIWTDTDPDRCGVLPFVFEDGMGFERYVDYLLDVPMYFVYRDGKYIDALGQSFRDFLNGRLPALPGEIPTLSDWADHLTTVFPEARVKKFIEMRGADGGPWRRLCALPALWVGLLYDASALDAAWDLVKGWDAETRESWRQGAGLLALDAEVNGTRMRDLAREVLAISEAGLKARARTGSGGLVPDETHFLNTLKESVETGRVPADELLEKYQGEWAGDLSRIYAEYSY